MTAARPSSDKAAPAATEKLAPSPGPVYLEGRLVLSLSFKGGHPDLAPIEDDDVVLENYRLWDDLVGNWHEEDLAVLRFEHADVVMRLEPAPRALWAGSVNTHARVVLGPDLDAAGFRANQACDLRWKKA